MPSRVRRLQAELDTIHLQREVDHLKEANRQLTDALRETTRLLVKLRPCGRQQVSGERKLYVAGLQRYRCANPFGSCPLWRCGDGTFGPEGWSIDHERQWSKGYDDRESNLRALCATCHFRVTKEAILRDESGDEEGDD